MAMTLVLVALLIGGWRLANRGKDSAGAGEDGFMAGFEKANIGMAVLTPSGEFIHANEALIGMLGTVAGANIRAWSMPTTSPSWARRGRTWAMATTRALPRGCGGGHPTAEPYGAGYRSRSCAPPNDARPRSCSNWRIRRALITTNYVWSA